MSGQAEHKAVGKVRVAIIGARGIGKYHARWWTLEGAEVAAIAGTSEASLAEAAEDLKERIGFSGRTYANIGQMLDAERPDIVDVCSPADRHAAHAQAALEAGCHVLCEKPLVLDRANPGASMREAGKLIALARGRGLRLGVCTQYAMAARSFTRLIDKSGLGPITYFKAQLHAPAK
ncbi:MAG: Gfo/Idh/MocA family oxidoreductase, partial [Candidatus Hydrogenedentota bacterium]